jgi:hypothetical protein
MGFSWARVSLAFKIAVAVAAAIPLAGGFAQDSSSSSSKSPRSSSKQTSAAKSTPDAGSVSAGVYRNPGFGFSCKIPAGWVLRTEEMNTQTGSESNGIESTPDAGKGERVLLAAFSRPPDARAEDVNASILIAVESAAAYPGLKDPAQYFGPVGEIARARGFEIVEEPHEFALGTKTMVRGDFQKNVGSRVMRQSTLVILVRGYAVSFTFIGGTEDEVEELVQALNFAKAAR